MFKKILIPVELDYPDTAAAVYQKAARAAEVDNAEIRLVTVMPGFGMPLVASYIPDEVRKETEDRFRESMEQFVQKHCHDSVTYALRSGKNWEEIIKEADKWGADLIVVYHNQRRDINEVFSRSCSQRVADHANCSVLWLRQVLS